MSTEICDYGCGQPSIIIFKNGKKCCSLKYRSCPHQAAKIGKTRLGKKHTIETKQKISNKLIGRESTFKGKKHTIEAKLRMSIKHKGLKTWATGFTKDTHPSLMSALNKRLEQKKYIHIGSNNGMYGKTHTDKVKQQSRDRNIRLGKWQGCNNPWFGKNRNGELSPRYLPNAERSIWNKYNNKVRMLTERTYNQNKNIINPMNLSRTISGYHLDHIIPIWYGFLHYIDPYIISHLKNLRMISTSDNCSRPKSTITPEEHLLLGEIQAMIIRLGQI